MTLPAPVPASSFHPGDFVADVDAEDAVYFLLNVGDGDTQLIVLPEFRGVRRALVVDVATTDKLPGLIEGPDDGLASRVLWTWPEAPPGFSLTTLDRPGPGL